MDSGEKSKQIAERTRDQPKGKTWRVYQIIDAPTGFWNFEFETGKWDSAPRSYVCRPMVGGLSRISNVFWHTSVEFLFKVRLMFVNVEATDPY